MSLQEKKMQMLNYCLQSCKNLAGFFFKIGSKTEHLRFVVPELTLFENRGIAQKKKI